LNPGHPLPCAFNVDIINQSCKKNQGQAGHNGKGRIKDKKLRNNTMVKTHYKARIAGMLIRGLDIILVIALFVCVREYVNFGHVMSRNTFYRVEFSLTHLLILIVLAVLWNRIFTFGHMYQLRQSVAWAKRLLLIAVACSLVVSTMLLGV
jgi:hypothetical protein